MLGHNSLNNNITTNLLNTFFFLSKIATDLILWIYAIYALLTFLGLNSLNNNMTKKLFNTFLLLLKIVTNLILWVDPFFQLQVSNFLNSSPPPISPRTTSHRPSAIAAGKNSWELYPPNLRHCAIRQRTNERRPISTHLCSRPSP